MKKQARAYSLNHYLLVLLAGITVILGAYFLCPEKEAPAPVPADVSTAPEAMESPGISEEVSEEHRSASENASSDLSSEEADTIRASSEENTSRASEASPIPVSYEILDSKYQYAQGYAWDDLYTLLVLIVKTSDIPEGMHPAFSLVRLSRNYDPMLLVGYQDTETKEVQYTVYITDSGYVYELSELSGTVKVSASEQALYLTEDDRKLVYLPHVFLTAKSTQEPSDLTDLNVHDLHGCLISAEELTQMVQDFTVH